MDMDSFPRYDENGNLVQRDNNSIFGAILMLVICPVFIIVAVPAVLFAGAAAGVGYCVGEASGTSSKIVHTKKMMEVNNAIGYPDCPKCRR
jgi:hypothetical protein